MKKRITDRLVKTLKPAGKPYEVRDDALPGFLFRVEPGGTMSFFVQFRRESGAKSRVKLGTFPTMSVPMARQKATSTLAEIAMGEDPVEEKRQARRNLTLRQFLDDHYAPWAKTNLKSHAPTLTRLRACFAPLMDKKLNELTAWHFEKHRQHRLATKLPTKQRPPTSAGINRDQQTLRAALSRAVQWGHLESNPLSGVKKAKEDRNRGIRALTPLEEASILDVFKARRDKAQEQRFKQSRAGKRTRPLPQYLNFLEPAFRLALETGIRRGELLSLLWADVDFTGGTLTVQGEGAKSAQTRVVPLPEKTRAMLARWKMESSGAGRVFPGITADKLKYGWNRLLKEAKVAPLRWHDLRHTYGSRLALAGAPLPTVQRLMGHADIKTTSRYLHAGSDDLKRAVALLDKPQNIVELKQAEGAE